MFRLYYVLCVTYDLFYAENATMYAGYIRVTFANSLRLALRL